MNMRCLIVKQTRCTLRFSLIAAKIHAFVLLIERMNCLEAMSSEFVGLYRFVEKTNHFVEETNHSAE